MVFVDFSDFLFSGANIRKERGSCLIEDLALRIIVKWLYIERCCVKNITASSEEGSWVVGSGIEFGRSVDIVGEFASGSGELVGGIVGTDG